MKNIKSFYIAAALITAVIFGVFAPAAVAQVAASAPVAVAAAVPTITADPSTVVPDAVQNFVLTFFLKTAVSHPWFATLISLMALARTWAKPASSIIHSIIAATGTTADDALEGKFTAWLTGTTLGKTFAYVIDWVFSIKLVAPSTAAAAKTV
jgi:hypothetical protein